MKRIALSALVLLGIALAVPQGASACFGRCVLVGSHCFSCQQSTTITNATCKQTAPCKCALYAVPSPPGCEISDTKPQQDLFTVEPNLSVNSATTASDSDASWLDSL